MSKALLVGDLHTPVNQPHSVEPIDPLKAVQMKAFSRRKHLVNLSFYFKIWFFLTIKARAKARVIITGAGTPV